MKLRRENLIRFYDERSQEEGRGSDVSALTALWGEDLLLGVLQHYWRRHDRAESEILSYTCSTGKKTGPRLDAWMLKREESGGESLYQIEVKNWAAYSLGERPLKLGASEEELRKYCEQQWSYYFGGDTLPMEAVAKVMAEMQRPSRFESRPAIPLLCFWFFISDGHRKPFSTHRYADGRRLDVFSASSYLRSLTEEHIEIPMPRAERRLKLLANLILPEV